MSACIWATGCTEEEAQAAISAAPDSHQLTIIDSVISTWHCIAKCGPTAKAWCAQWVLLRIWVAPAGKPKVSPCQWKAENSRNSPSQSSVTALSTTRTIPQPISLTGFFATGAPNALAIICPPRQCPMTGMSRARQSRINASSSPIHGSGSLALMGPPISARPLKLRTSAGTGAPSSILNNCHGMKWRSRNVAR